EHLGTGRHHLGDHKEVDTSAARGAGGLRHGQIVLEPFEHLSNRSVINSSAYSSRHSRASAQPRPLSPRALAAPSRKPRTMANSSGSSSRKASWPLSVTISANDTRAPPALSACTIARESEVGNSQSEVNEMTQKRVGVSLKALASAPSK